MRELCVNGRARLREEGLAQGELVGVDSTTLEANAALETLRRKDTGESYREFVEGLAEQAGEPVGTVAERVAYDRARRGKSLSNKEWESPVDADAKVAKMKNGSTDMAHKAEHAVELESGALLGVTVQGAELGATQTLGATLAAVEAAGGEKPQAVSADKGYHSDATITALEAEGEESYVPEPQRGERNWEGKEETKRAVVSLFISSHSAHIIPLVGVTDSQSNPLLQDSNRFEKIFDPLHSNDF